VKSNDELVVLVSGASRGVGRGIAKAFARLGATVYVVGRTRRGGAQRKASEAVLPGTIEDVAKEVDAAGGRGVPAFCDMGDDAQIEALFERVRRESGHLDVLVNNAAFLHNDMAVQAPFWEKSVQRADIIDVGLRCHYVAMHRAIPLMLGRGKGLIANISFYPNARMHDPAYYASKAGLDAMAATAAPELAPLGVAAVSVWPGIVATERLQAVFDQVPAIREQIPSPETPEFVGAVLAALWRDEHMLQLSGKTLIAAELGVRYGLKDEGGRQPPSHRGVFGVPHPANDLPPNA
jgi:NAD(P)-dependent dehydrogenase (short-subunit alcohol dehydrogenase family)